MLGCPVFGNSHIHNIPMYSNPDSDNSYYSIYRDYGISYYSITLLIVILSIVESLVVTLLATLIVTLIVELKATTVTLTSASFFGSNPHERSHCRPQKLELPALAVR